MKGLGMKLKMMKKFKVIGILTVTLLFLFVWQSRSSAQTTTQLESRLSRLEFENNALQTSLNQLEAQVSRLSSRAGLEFSLNEAPAAGDASALADDPTFKRLATLVIELKERVVAVEEQINRENGSLSGE
jgi:predicted RNase H-like nuclease (RuvC/YqgF family)